MEYPLYFPKPVGCGEYESVKTAAKAIVRTAGIVEPEADLAAVYEIKYQQFGRIYPTVKNLF